MSFSLFGTDHYTTVQIPTVQLSQGNSHCTVLEDEHKPDLHDADRKTAVTKNVFDYEIYIKAPQKTNTHFNISKAGLMLFVQLHCSNTIRL